MVLFFLSISAKSQTNHSLYFLAGATTFEEKYPESEFLHYPQPAFGLGYEIGIPLKNNFSFRSGLSFQSKSGNWRYIELNNEISYDISTTINLFSFSIPVKLYYEIPFKKSSISLGVGIFAGVNIIGIQNTHFKMIYNDSEYFNYSSNRINWKGRNNFPESYDLKRLDLGTTFSFDYKIKRITLGVNSEFGFRNLSPYNPSELKFVTRSLMLKFGYILKKKDKSEVEK